MFHKVTLSKEEQTEEVVVREARLLEDNITLKHADPEIFPEYMRDDIVFVSKDLSALILANSPVTIEKVEPTEDKPVEVQPVF